MIMRESLRAGPDEVGQSCTEAGERRLANHWLRRALAFDTLVLKRAADERNHGIEQGTSGARREKLKDDRDRDAPPDCDTNGNRNHDNGNHHRGTNT